MTLKARRDFDKYFYLESKSIFPYIYWVTTIFDALGLVISSTKK